MAGMSHHPFNAKSWTRKMVKFLSVLFCPPITLNMFNFQMGLSILAYEYAHTIDENAEVK